MKEQFDKLYILVRNLGWILRLSYESGKKLFIIRIIVTVSFVLFPIVSAWVLKLIIDEALLIGRDHFRPWNLLTTLIILKLCLDVGVYFLENFLEGLFKIMRYNLEYFFVNLVIRKLNQFDIEFFENSRFLDLKQKVLDTYTYRPTEFLNVAFWSLYNLLQISIQGIIIFKANPIWLLLLYFFQIPALIILLKIGEAAWNIWDADSTIRRKFFYFSNLFGNISYIKEFALYRVGDYFIEKVLSLLSEFHNNAKQIERKKIYKGFFGVLLSNIPTMYIMINLVVFLAQGKISVGIFTFYIASLAAFYLALQNLIKNINYGYEINLYIKEIRKFLEMKNKIRNDGVTFLKTQSPLIEINDISFSYPNSQRKVFKDFSMTIQPNQKIALVGENGSGKTTLIKLICRFYDVDRGEITINGINIKNYDRNSLCSLYAVLFQDFVGYDLTVAENISIGKIRKVNNKKLIEQAADMAGADEFIKNLPEKYKQILGNAFANGEQLSTGQWQKIALAKAFMRNSPVIILDEPTAAVDAKTEYEIFTKIMQLIDKKTVLIVSHRFSTVRKADEIIVLDKGKIMEKGTHEELLKSNGKYAHLFNLQAKAYQ